MINKQDTIDGRREQTEKIGGEKMAETARCGVRPSSNMMEILAGSSTQRGQSNKQYQPEEEFNLNKGITPSIK